MKNDVLGCKLILTEVLGGLLKGKEFKHVIIFIFLKLINHTQWLPYCFEGPPD